MRFVLISDTHGQHDQLRLPAGDILIHAGDFTRHGEDQDAIDFNDWLGSLPYQHKIVIAGNHDFCCEIGDGSKLLSNACYLQDSAVTIAGLKFYGSPWQPRFFDWAFNLDRGEPLKQKWDLIPSDTDILITHGPPFDICDQTNRGMPVGCQDLLDAVTRIQPKLHVFGHIHEAYGQIIQGQTIFANASICDLGYRIINEPLVVDC